MLKKLFKIGMLASLLVIACTATAQEKNYQLQYPQYGFWSNWSIGGDIVYNWECVQGTPFEWRVATNAGLGLFFEKELNHVWDARFHFVLPGLWKSLKSDPEGDHYDRYGKIGVDFKFSINNARKGYDPDRKGNFYIMAGLGMSGDYKREELGLLGMYMQGGIGYSHQCGEHSTWFIELDQDVIANVPSFFLGPNWDYTNTSLMLGWMYNFGPTQEDLDLIAQRAMLTQENFDKMSNEIDGLRNDLRDAKTREAKLINRINELESQKNEGSTKIVKNGGNGVGSTDDATVDSLRRIIDSYETNKHNFYALPFSILYDVDQYTVSDDQMDKINAIAKVMKDNEDVNFDIIGYCDYSGSDAYNQKLSEKRADYVKKLLVKRGVNEDRLTTSGKGKSMSFGDIKNAINRRVSFYRVSK